MSGRHQPIDAGRLGSSRAHQEWQVHTHGRITSTNDLAARVALPWQVVVADEQTAGRGRRGRVWTTPPGTALLVSFTVPMAADPARGAWLPMVAGLAVREALRTVAPDLPVSLKWPNDILVNERKLAGILCLKVPAQPLSSSQRPSHPASRAERGPQPPDDPTQLGVIGIGLNISQTVDQLPIPNATSLALEGVRVSRSQVLASLTTTIEIWHRAWLNGDDGGQLGSALDMRAEYSRVCATLGREVTVLTSDGQPFSGRAVGVEQGGQLRVRSAAGRIASFNAADVIHAQLSVSASGPEERAGAGNIEE